MTRKSNGKRILVALSGGVDSSVAAALLQETGNQVEGAIMLLEGMKEENIDFAGAAADQLDIPFHRFDFRRQHQEGVVDYFVSEYQRGLTPNPCVVCNKIIKFGLFMQKAQEMKIDLMATGHYASIEQKNV
ncbi:MAG: asparagine synthase-related protein, partial [candidate division WOR-3 bacterium]